jgi:hypothetical protein
MKKFSLLLGTLGGAFGAYVLGNSKLRKQLMHAKDTESAAKILGKHLQEDGKKVAKEVRTFVESDDVQRNWKSFKGFAADKLKVAKKELDTLVKKNFSGKKGKKK